MKKLSALFLLLVAAAPPAIAWTIDSDFSSGAHVPVVSIAGIAVALCDALFGQIVALTRDLPFQYGHTPAQVDIAIERFEFFHIRIFGAWIFAKSMSALAIILPAVTATENAGKWVEHNREWILLVGYVALGLALSSAIYFFGTYLKARREFAKARRQEILRRYIEENDIQNTPESEAVERARDLSLAGYNSKPEIID